MRAVSPHSHTLSCPFPSVVLGSILPTLRQFQGFCHGYWDTGILGQQDGAVKEGAWRSGHGAQKCGYGRAHMLMSFVSTTQTRVVYEEGASAEELPPADWPVASLCGHFLD